MPFSNPFQFQKLGDLCLCSKSPKRISLVQLSQAPISDPIRSDGEGGCSCLLLTLSKGHIPIGGEVVLRDGEHGLNQ